MTKSEPAELTDFDLRAMALNHAIRAAKKIPYGPHSAEFVTKLAEAFYKFLKS